MQDISRVTRSKADARASYDRMSRFYDWFAASEKRFADIGLAMLAAQAGEYVLEIGYGTGHALVCLARTVGETGQVHGIDLSEGMRQLTEKRIADAGLRERVKLELGDACHLPYTDASFDAILMCFTLELFDSPEIPMVLAECKRVLRENSRICVVSLLKENSLAVHIYEWFHRHMPRAVDCRPIRASLSLETSGFTLEAVRVEKMWGLPVEIVLGRKK